MKLQYDLVEKYTNNQDYSLNKGYYQVWTQNPKTHAWRSIWGFTIQDFETLEYNSVIYKVETERKKLDINPDLNYYVTRNPMKTSNKGKGISELRGITKLVIDIDVKENKHLQTSYKELSKKLIYYLDKDLIRSKEIPAFSKVVFSGRGVQVHYDIEQIAPFGIFISLSDMVIDSIANKIERVLNDYNDLNVYSVDYSASHNHAGLIRFVGLNQKSYEAVTYKNYNIKYNLNDLLMYLNIGEKPQKKARNDNAPKQQQSLHLGRLRRLELTQSHRIANHTYLGYRNKLVFLYFNSLLGVNYKEVLDKVYQFNRNFPIPLPTSEIRAMERYFNIKGCLRFRSHTFYNTWLEMTPEERESIEKIVNSEKNHSEAGVKARQKQKQKEKAKRKQRREYELQKRLNVLKDTNTTNKEKAQLLNVSISTIQRLKRKHKELL